MEELLALKEAFSDIEFVSWYNNKPAHMYKVGNTKLKSISGCISMIGNKFDPSISKYSAKKEGIPRHKIISRWDKIKTLALNKGNRVHDFSEDYLNGIVTKEKAFSDDQMMGVLEFLETLPKHIVYGVPEIKMYNLEHRIAGTQDLPLYNTITKKFIVADWKTNENIYKNFNHQMLKKPFNFLMDMPINKYQIQLNFYQFMMEKAGFEVEDRIVIWLRKDERTGKYFKPFSVNDMQGLIKQWLNDNRKYN